MDIEAFGIRDNRLAPGITGSAPDGSCYFDELMDGLQRKGQNLAPGQQTSVGTDLTPDVVETAKEIRGLKSLDSSGNQKPFIYSVDNRKLFPPGHFTTPNPLLADLLDGLNSRMNAARKELGDEALGDTLKNARTAAEGIHEQRVREMSENLIDTANDYLQNEKHSSTKVVTEELTDMEGGKYTRIDMAMTAVADKNFIQYWAGFSPWLQQFKGGKTDKGKARSHYNAMRGFQGLSGRLQRKCT